MGFKSMCCLKTTLQPLYQVMLHLNYHNASEKKKKKKKEKNPIYLLYCCHGNIPNSQSHQAASRWWCEALFDDKLTWQYFSVSPWKYEEAAAHWFDQKGSQTSFQPGTVSSLKVRLKLAYLHDGLSDQRHHSQRTRDCVPFWITVNKNNYIMLVRK